MDVDSFTRSTLDCQCVWVGSVPLWVLSNFSFSFPHSHTHKQLWMIAPITYLGNLSRSWNQLQITIKIYSHKKRLVYYAAFLLNKKQKFLSHIYTRTHLMEQKMENVCQTTTHTKHTPLLFIRRVGDSYTYTVKKCIDFCTETNMFWTKKKINN